MLVVHRWIFVRKKKIGLDIDSEYLPLRTANGYDHNYIFKNDRTLKKVAKLYSSESGISMTVLSDLCGLQIYTGNFLNGQAGKMVLHMVSIVEYVLKHNFILIHVMIRDFQALY